MSETNNQQPGPAAPGAPASATPATVPTGQESGGAAPAQDNAKPASAGKGAQPHDGLSRAERAARRAAERLAASKPGAAPNSSISPVGAEGKPAGDGTPPVAGGPTSASGEAPNGGTAPAGASEGSSSSDGSTVNAPDDWSAEAKARFMALPNDEARQQTLDFYRDMQRDYTQAKTTLAELRKGHEELSQTLDEHGIDAAEAKRVLSLSLDFNKDPRGVIQRLAAQAGVDVFFEAPLAPDQIPEFKSTADMVKWFDERMANQQRSLAEKAEREAAERAALDRDKQVFRDSLQSLAEKYGETFATKRVAVIERMMQPTSMEDAFLLLQLPDLRQQAEEGARAKQELAALRAQVEADRAARTAPPRGAHGVPGSENSDLSRAERAMARAERKIAARANA